MEAVDKYYYNAFSPEIVSAFQFVENSKLAAELISELFKFGAEKSETIKFDESRFQMNLLYIQKKFEDAIGDIKLNNNHILFIDGIDIRPGKIPYADYLDCVKGLANAVWSLNNDFFSKIKDSKRFRVVLLLRPDIFDSLGLQNQTNKLHDNSVYLDWRTTYESHRASKLFKLVDNLFKSQQDNKGLSVGDSWDHYLPWWERSTNPQKRDRDSSFICMLRLTYCRPRDLITMLHIMKEEYQRLGVKSDYFESRLIIENHSFREKYSRYLMGGIKDQLSFYYDNTDYDIFLKFFLFLDGKDEFDYDEYKRVYNVFVDEVLNHDQIPEFVESAETFLQFLYASNIISYCEAFDYGVFYRWCYRERSLSNINPKVKLFSKYKIHEGLHKELNVGRLRK